MIDKKKYVDAYIRRYNNKSISDFLGKRRDFTVKKWYKGFENRECIYNYYALFTDEEDNIKMYVEFTKEIESYYKNIKTIYKDTRFKDDDKVILLYFKIIEVF